MNSWPKEESAGDLLYGAAAISEFLFGTPKERRRVYTLDTAGAIPTFRLARVLCARRSSIEATIAARESNATKAPRDRGAA